MLDFLTGILCPKCADDAKKKSDPLGSVNVLSSRETMMNVLVFADRAKNSPVLLKSLIRAICKKRQYDLILALSKTPAEMNDERVPCYTWDPFLFPYLDVFNVTEKYEFLTLSLASDVLLPWPWDEGLYLSNQLTKGTNVGKPWKQDRSHQVTFILPLNFGFVNSGNHSIMTGIMKGEGLVKPDEVLDIALIL